MKISNLKLPKIEKLVTFHRSTQLGGPQYHIVNSNGHLSNVRGDSVSTASQRLCYMELLYKIFKGESNAKGIKGIYPFLCWV
jgi:hypothetical protein